VFSLGFYTYQTVIWRSILTVGSVVLPFGCYPISFGNRVPLDEMYHFPLVSSKKANVSEDF